MAPETLPEAVPDVGAFLARLVRLEPGALVRLRPAGTGVVELWARLPFDVLATRSVRWPLGTDATVRAGELLARLERGEPGLPARHDLEWRSPLPSGPGSVLEVVPGGEIRRIAEAAAETIRAGSRRGVGERRLRDEVLDHVALIVTLGDERFDVPVRLVQGLVRMGFPDADPAAPVRVRTSAGWLALEGRFGCVWQRIGGGLHLGP